MLKRMTLPGNELSVSNICLGTANFGETTDEREAFRQMDEFVSRGGNFINTARAYTSEPIIGRWMKARNNRDALVVCSKGGEDHAKVGDCRALRRHELIKSCEESLSRLGTDRLDLFVLHLDDERVPVAEIVDALDELRACGKVLHVGCSNWRIPRVREALAYARETGKIAFSINEIEFSLARLNTPNGQTACLWLDDEYRAFAREVGMTIAAYSPQATGLFSKLLSGAPLSDWTRKQYINAHNLAAADRVADMARELGVPVPALAVAYVMGGHGFPCVPIVGARTCEQLCESLRAADIALDRAALDRLEGKTA